MDFIDPYAERSRYPRRRSSSLTIAITAHGRGIGGALAIALSRRGDTVMEFACAPNNAYGVSEAIFPRIAAADVFICDAYSDPLQTDLLTGVARAWAECPERIIVALCSGVAQRGRVPIEESTVEATCERLQACPDVKCRITLLSCGEIAASMTAAGRSRRAPEAEVIGHVLYAIDQPTTHNLTRLDFRVRHGGMP